MKRNPCPFAALSGFGRMHFQAGQNDKAITYLQWVPRVNPNLGLEQDVKIARKLQVEVQKQPV